MTKLTLQDKDPSTLFAQAESFAASLQQEDLINLSFAFLKFRDDCLPDDLDVDALRSTKQWPEEEAPFTLKVLAEHREQYIRYLQDQATSSDSDLETRLLNLRTYSEIHPFIEPIQSLYLKHYDRLDEQQKNSPPHHKELLEAVNAADPSIKILGVGPSTLSLVFELSIPSYGKCAVKLFPPYPNLSSDGPIACHNQQTFAQIIAMEKAREVAGAIHLHCYSIPDGVMVMELAEGTPLSAPNFQNALKVDLSLAPSENQIRNSIHTGVKLIQSGIKCDFGDSNNLVFNHKKGILFFDYSLYNHESPQHFGLTLFSLVQGISNFEERVMNYKTHDIVRQDDLSRIKLKNLGLLLDELEKSFPFVLDEFRLHENSSSSNFIEVFFQTWECPDAAIKNARIELLNQYSLSKMIECVEAIDSLDLDPPE